MCLDRRGEEFVHQSFSVKRPMCLDRKRWGCAMTVCSEVMSVTMLAIALTGSYWAIKVITLQLIKSKAVC
jgi:hypothetical protein